MNWTDESYSSWPEFVNFQADGQRSRAENHNETVNDRSKKRSEDKMQPGKRRVQLKIVANTNYL